MVATSGYLLLLQGKDISAMYLKLPVYVMIVISFHNQPKIPLKSHIYRFRRKFEMWPFFIKKFAKSSFRDSEVIKTS